MRAHAMIGATTFRTSVRALNDSSNPPAAAPSSKLRMNGSKNGLGSASGSMAATSTSD